MQRLGAGRAAEPPADADSAVAARERRRTQRIRTVYRVAKVARDHLVGRVAGQVVGLWRVRNISDFGMMLLTGAGVSRGERLTIALSDSVALDAKVVWCGDECCGVEFDQPIDSARLLTSLVAEQTGARHRAPRLEVDIRATAYCEFGIHPVRISDLSQYGLGFRHDGAFHQGMRTMVMLENGVERRGTVSWSRDGRAGLRLHEPFSCAELEDVSAPRPQDPSGPGLHLR